MTEKVPRIWSKKILRVVRRYCRDESLTLFGITGDLDNLGVFVSRHGRPLAENLVDVYNRMIGAYMSDLIHARAAQIPAFCMIPSGEEIFALGVAIDPRAAIEFFAELRQGANDYLLKYAPLSGKDVGISFGCGVFPSDVLRPLAVRFVRSIRRDELANAGSAYLDLMLAMRTQLAVDLDVAKFAPLINGQEKNVAIFLRNLVYLHLRRYKCGTRAALIAVAERATRDEHFQQSLRLSSFNLAYGVTGEDETSIEDLIK